MLRIYGIKKDEEYVSFWLKRQDADDAASKEGGEVVPIEIQENCPGMEGD